MPVAVVQNPLSDKIDLKTLPGGYVVIRRMTHGQKLERQAFTSRLKFSIAKKRDMQGEIDLMQKAVSLWEFKNLVAEHNLEDLDGRTLNFTNPADVEKLDGKVAEEITAHINALNNFEEDADDDETELGNS